MQAAIDRLTDRNELLQTSIEDLTDTIKQSPIGMDPEVCAHVFEKFFQGDPSHSKQGYGVGLAIVQRVVTLTGGSVSVTSEPGKGSCFTVTLPR